MKRKDYSPGLFDAPAWEQEQQAREGAMVAPIGAGSRGMAPEEPNDPDGQFEIGKRLWIEARIASLLKIRGIVGPVISPACARELAEIDFEESLTPDTSVDS